MGHKSHGQEQDLQGQDRGQKLGLEANCKCFGQTEGVNMSLLK